MKREFFDIFENHPTKSGKWVYVLNSVPETEPQCRVGKTRAKCGKWYHRKPVRYAFDGL